MTKKKEIKADVCGWCGGLFTDEDCGRGVHLWWQLKKKQADERKEIKK